MQSKPGLHRLEHFSPERPNSVHDWDLKTEIALNLKLAVFAVVGFVRLSINWGSERAAPCKSSTFVASSLWPLKSPLCINTQSAVPSRASLLRHAFFRLFAKGVQTFRRSNTDNVFSLKRITRTRKFLCYLLMCVPSTQLSAFSCATSS